MNTIRYISLEQLRMKNMQRTSAIEIFAVWFSPPSLSESAPVFLILTTCFFGRMMANFDINVYIIACGKRSSGKNRPMLSSRPYDM